MAFTALTSNIPVQPGTGGFKAVTDGTVYKGQGVYWSADNTVKEPTTSGSTLAGIAGYTKTTGEQIVVYGPGSLVRCQLSGTITAGTLVGLHIEGWITPDVVTKNAVVTKGVATTGEGEILILFTQV